MKPIKFLLKFFLVIFSLMIVVWFTVLGFLQTKKGQEWVYHKVISYVEHTTNAKIEIEDIRFSFPLNLSLKNISISENDIPLATIGHLDVCCAYHHFMQGKIVISTLHISDVHLLHLPSSPSSSLSSSNPPQTIPLLPFYFKLEDVEIEKLTLSQDVIKNLEISPHLAQILEDLAIDLQGSLINRPFRQLLEGDLQILFHPLKDIKTFYPLFSSPFSIHMRYAINAKEEVELSDLTLNHADFSFVGNMIFNSDYAIEEALFEGKIPNLNILQPFMTQHVKGSLQFEGGLSGNLSEPSLFLQLQSPSLHVDQHVFSQFRSSFEMTSHLENLKGLMTLSFVYDHHPFKLTTDFHGNLAKQMDFPDIQIHLLQTYLEGNLSYSFEDSIWTGKLQSEKQNLHFLANLIHLPLKGEGKMDLSLASFMHPPLPKEQGFHLHFTGQDLAYEEAKIDSLELHTQGVVPQDFNSPISIRTFFDTKKMEWKDYALEHYQGEVTFHANVMQQTLTQLDLHAEGTDLHAPEGKIAHLNTQMRVNDPLKIASGEIQFICQDVQTSKGSLENLAGRTSFHMSQDAWPLRLEGKGKLQESFSFYLDGKWYYEKELFAIELQQLKGEYGAFPFTLLQPFRLITKPHEMHISTVFLKSEEKEIQADFHQEHDNILAHFKTNLLSLHLLQPFFPDVPLVGSAALQGQIQGTLEKPKGDVNIDLQNVQFSDSFIKQRPKIAGRIHLNLDEKGVQLNSELSGISQAPFQIKGSFPLHLSLVPFQLDMPPDFPLDLALSGEGELEPYLSLLSNDLANLSGYAKLFLKVKGTRNAPLFEGYLDLTKGTYESLSTGVFYHNIQAHLEGNGSKIILKQFSAQDNTKGAIHATGSIIPEMNQFFPFEIFIRPSHIFILNSDYAAISASGELKLHGNTKGAQLQGVLNVDQAHVNLDQSLPQSVKTVDIRYINVPQGEQVPNYLEKAETTYPIDLDVKLDVSHPVIVDGNHIKSEWKGAINARGTFDNPQFYGDLRIAKGEFDLSGKIFNLSQGNIHFAGASAKKANLYVVATKEIDRFRVEIIVKGSLTEPVISFRSNPPLSQREVLSYILFNKGISDITVDEGDQLSQSFMSMQSDQTSEGNDFLSRLRNNIGIDRLDITTSTNGENKNLALQVGKRITENLFVSVNQNVTTFNQNETTLSPVVAVEAKLKKNFKLQAEAGIGDNVPIRMSLKWQKDY